ncbi:hypothetical protein [Cohnella soli]|uniref:Uncharacterized protein n=1 Tax=Cohnella soli TaxID=425005 RepID=A0ABW0HMG6_9BACL
MVYKAKLAIAAGMENILFMSGTWMLEDNYWEALAAAYPSLREFDAACTEAQRTYVVHLAYGTSGAYAEEFVPAALPLLAGLPVQPVRGDQNTDDGELLLFFGDYRLSKEWQAKLPLYKKVVFDREAMARNREIIQQLHDEGACVAIWDHNAGSLSADEEIPLLREFLDRETWRFPRLCEGRDIGVIGVGDSGKVLLINLRDTENRAVLQLPDIKLPFVLKPLSFAVLNPSGALEEFPTIID